MRICRHLDSFKSSRNGSVAIVFALCTTGLFGIMAMAVDFARAHNVSSKIATALDAAALAGAKMLDGGGSDAQIQQAAESYFNAHIETLRVHDATLTNLSASIDRTNSTVTTSVNANLGTTFGRAIGRNSIDIVKSSTVNFQLRDIELAMALDLTGSMNDNGKIGHLQNAAKDVLDTLLQDARSEMSARVALVPWATSVNAGSLANTVSAGMSTDGCVVERTGSEAASDAVAMGSTAVGTADSAMAPAYSCLNDPVMPLAGKSKLSSLKSVVDGFNANGGTAGHIGTAWGWYMVSPSWGAILPSSAVPAPYNQAKTIKAVLLMTDGEFNVAYDNPSPYSTAQVDESYAKYRALCDGMRAKKVVVYTVGFGLTSGSRAETELQFCATTPAHFFPAATGNDLKDAFRTIASQLMSLRVAK